MNQQFTIEGVYPPMDERDRRVYLPVQIPPGATKLSVDASALEVHRGAREEHAITLGAFDTRGNQFLTTGFRGWVSRKVRFEISPESATPGFLRGPLQPGEWTIMLTMPKREMPLPYSLSVSIDVDPERADAPIPDMPDPSKLLAAAVAGGSNGGGRWYKGDLHAHSIHSDGDNTVDEVIASVRRSGLDYFALTDHNTVSHWEDLARLNTGAPLLIGGEEITMFGGHANVWALDGWVDFRIRTGSEVEQLIEHARSRGSIFSVCHPDSPTPWKHDDVAGYQAMEVWNSPWRFYNEPALVRWQFDLNRGRRIIAVGGSDSHCVPPAYMHQPNLPGEPCTWVYVDGPLTQRSVLAAVEAGHVFLSEDPRGPFIELRADADGDGVHEALPGDIIEPPTAKTVRFRLRYRGPDGKHVLLLNRKGIVKDITAPSEEIDEEIELSCQGRDYLRVEVRGYRGRPDRGDVVHALTNPIYWGRWN